MKKEYLVLKVNEKKERIYLKKLYLSYLSDT